LHLDYADLVRLGKGHQVVLAQHLHARPVGAADLADEAAVVPDFDDDRAGHQLVLCDPQLALHGITLQARTQSVAHLQQA
jgi:hypothetical protein